MNNNNNVSWGRCNTHDHNNRQMTSTYSRVNLKGSNNNKKYPQIQNTASQWFQRNNHINNKISSNMVKPKDPNKYLYNQEKGNNTSGFV